MKLSQKIGVSVIAGLLCLSLGACSSQKETTPVQELTETPKDIEETPKKIEELTPEGVASAETKEYRSKSDFFSISVAGEWTVTPTGNDEFIVLDNEDQSLTVMAQRFPKANVQASIKVESLEQFVDFYHKNAIAGLIEKAGEPKKEELIIEGVNAVAEEITATMEGITAKAYNAYIETDTSYYSFTVTGIEELYDTNIEDLKEVAKTLKEK